MKTWDGTKEIELLDCPFCGSKPEVRYIGNDYTKKRKIEIVCKGKCRAKQTNAAITQGFLWLEEVAFKLWNQRV